jgi:PKD repeat protein
MGTYTVTLTATNQFGSDSEVKTGYITVTAPVQPVADFTASATDINIGNSVTFTDTSMENPTSWSWTFDGGTPATSTAQNPVITYNTVGVFDVTLVATNAQGSDTETKVGYITVSVKPYCASQGNTYSMEWVARVQVDTLDNASGAAGYTDFTSITCNLEAGTTVNVVLTPGFNGGPWTEYWKIWIDYNDDHDFEDAGEEVFSGAGTSTVSGSFTVTPGVNVVSRMRVSMKYAGYPTPCETFTYGEVEDYTAAISSVGNQPPTADFTYTTDDLTVDFTDASTDPDGTIAGWDWDFGDGNTSTLPNPTHTYAAAGTYTVTLTVTDDDSATDSISKDVTVTGPNTPPTADFTFTINDLTVNFTDASTDPDGTIIGWDWDFGDGNTSTVQNPGHTYAAAGTYTVTLTVTDDDSATDSISKSVTVTEPNTPPTADFTFTTGDLTANFTDASTDPDGTIVGWLWDFGDGNTSTAQNPGHTYAAAGTYTVTLTVTDDDGASDSISKSVTVTAPNIPPTADFTFAVNYLTVNFTDASTDADGTIVSWLWNFGDGNTSTAQNPTHTYAAAGTYTVTLTVTDNDGASDSISKSVTVTAPNMDPVANFSFTTIGLTANFSDLSYDPDGTIVSWLWNFGDGNTSTLQNPSHTYAAAGTYTVTLTVTDNNGASDSISKTVTVSLEIYVYDITQTAWITGKNYTSTAVVTILDTNNSPVANATVTITWSGVVGGSASGVTAVDGTVSFVSDKVKSSGPFTITVNDVTHATMPYNPALNIETSDTANF